MCISDLGSDVCSSDLLFAGDGRRGVVSTFQLRQILAWRNAADDPVRAIRQRRLVYDGIEHRRLDTLRPAPVLWDDVVHINVLPEKYRMEIGRAPWWERVCALVYITIVAV